MNFDTAKGSAEVAFLGMLKSAFALCYQLELWVKRLMMNDLWFKGTVMIH